MVACLLPSHHQICESPFLGWVLTYVLCLCSGNAPDENVLALPDNDEDLEITRYKQLSTALRGNRLLVHVTTVSHPEGLLEGTSQTGPASLDWPTPSW